MTEMGSFKIILYCLIIPLYFTHGIKAGELESDVSSNNKTELNTNSTTDILHNTTLYSDNKTEILQITIYYETLCPGSMIFFVTSLAAVTALLGPYIHVHMVPYGSVKEKNVGDHKELECQHGPEECRGNKIHACAVDIIKNNTEAVIFNACLMMYTLENYPLIESYDYALNSCGKKHGVNSNEIKKCLNSNKGDILFKSYGVKTTHFFKKYNGDTPVQKYVPYVVFENEGLNNTMDRREKDMYFFLTICNLIQPRPEVCQYHP